MPTYVFPGHPGFLEAAGAGLGHPEAAGPALRIVPLTAMANLCAQAATAPIEDARAILAKAVEFRDQIATALRAADLMLEDVRIGRGLATPPVPSRPAPAAARHPGTHHKRQRTKP